jgi:two-component system, LuxR family, response regulator FixJ
MSPNANVFIVEDDAATRDAFTRLLRLEGLSVKAYESAESFLDEYDQEWMGCLLADVRLPGINGIELMQKLVLEGSALAVVIVTGHGDVPLAVAAVKAGAFDFLEKPFDPKGLVASVRKALAHDKRRGETASPRAEFDARLAELSPRERQVMDMVVDGQHNKAIAAALGISTRTVEYYRSNVMTKMGVRSRKELVDIAFRLRDSSS